MLGKVDSVPRTFNIERHTQSHSTLIDPNNPCSHAIESKYYYNEYHSDNTNLLDMDPNCIMMKEIIIQKALTDRYADYNNTKKLIPRKSFTSKGRHKRKKFLQIAEDWCIGYIRAEATLEATTQNASRSAILPISRRYRADRRYKVKRLDGKFSTNTIYSDVKSLLQTHYAQVFTAKFGFAAVYPIPGSDGPTVGLTLKDFISDYGAPAHLTFDGALVQTVKILTS